jgi:hypothetical protein
VCCVDVRVYSYTRIHIHTLHYTQGGLEPFIYMANVTIVRLASEYGVVDQIVGMCVCVRVCV